MIKFIDTNSKKLALEKAPWAVKVVKTEQGYLAFQNVKEYFNWKYEDEWKRKHVSNYKFIEN